MAGPWLKAATTVQKAAPDKPKGSMYLVKVTVFKEIHTATCVTAEMPSFFHEGPVEETRKYVADHFKDVATLYLEWLEDPEEGDVVEI